MLLLTCVSAASADESAAPPPASAARPGGVARAASRDLLCPLAAKTPGTAPASFSAEPLACSCAVPRDRCRLVGIGNDRRRGLVLAAGTSVARVLARDGSDELRFAVAARGVAGSAIELHVVA
ncbi:hypothetical protein K2Z84_18405, partial [Candidatus Binatia bacterium]|nr:hypothetical protein [Candidatus Binatia bacterium]